MTLTLTSTTIIQALLGLAVGNVVAGVFLKTDAGRIAERIFFQTWAILMFVLIGGN